MFNIPLCLPVHCVQMSLHQTCIKVCCKLDLFRLKSGMKMPYIAGFEDLKPVVQDMI